MSRHHHKKTPKNDWRWAYALLGAIYYSKNKTPEYELAAIELGYRVASKLRYNR